MKPTKNRFLSAAVLAVVGVALVAGCNRDPLRDLSPEDSQVFITNHDASANFGNYKTFSIRDSVAVLGNQGQVQYSTTSRELDFVARVISNLEQRGYVRVERSQNPDIGVNVARVSNSYTGVTANPFYDPFWGGWGGWGWGGGLYYPQTYSYYQVRENYWYSEIIDLKNPRAGQNGQQQLPVVWTAEIRGNGIFDQTSISRVVDAVFAQSEYLRTSR
jgi:hypothetical protein